MSNGTTTTEDTYGYDAAGNTTTHTDADGRTTTTVYDPAGRVTQTTATGGGSTLTTATTALYDPNGNSVSGTVQTTDSTKPGQTQTSTHAATYDAEDRQSTETDNGLTTAYTYDAAGQQRTQSVQEGQTAVTTAYDAEGRVTSMSEGAGGAGPYVSTFGYNANDQLQTVGLPGGVQQSTQYDPNSQLVGVTAGGPNTGAAFTHLSSQYGYTYDGAGRVSSVTTLSGTDNLAYDGPSRLMNEAAQNGSTQVIAKGGVYHWSYDANGNILTAVDDAGYTTGGITYTNVYTYSTSMPDEIAQMGTTGAAMTKTTSYSYDTRGDVTRIANTAATSDKNALVQTLSYDGQGRVVQVTYLDHSNNNTTTTITLAYNAEGQRSAYDLAQAGAPVLHQTFAYRNGELAEQTVVSGTTLLYVNTYLYGPQGQPLELLHAQPGQTTARYWYVLDGQDNVVALTDANGVVIDRYAYDQWGEETSSDKTDEHVPQQLRYGGYWYDEKLSWYWLSVRYYDPETARFLQPDPSEQEGVQSYVYVGDAPTALFDPTGFAGGFRNPPGPNGWLAAVKRPFPKDRSQGVDPLNVVFTSGSFPPVPELMYYKLNWAPVNNSSHPNFLFDEAYTEYADVGDGKGRQAQAYTWRGGAYGEAAFGGDHARGWPQAYGGGTAWFLAVSNEYSCGLSHCIQSNGFNQGRDDLVEKIKNRAKTGYCSPGCTPFASLNYEVERVDYRPVPRGSGSNGVHFDGRVAVITLKYSPPY